MALSKLTADISNKFLKCGICFEDYTEPKALPCLHFFCKHCLIGYVSNLQKQKARKTFPCPLCRREVDIPKDGVGDLPKMIFLDNLREYLARQDTLVSDENICNTCRTNTGHFMCDQCDHFLCDDCRKVHDSLKLARGHYVGTIAEIKERRANAKIGGPVFCDKHPDKELEFYCKTDEVPICLNCKLTSHDGHRCIDIGDASKEGVATLKTMADEMGSKLERLREKKTRSMAQKKNWLDQKKAAEGAARAHVDQLTQALTKAIQDSYREVMKKIQANFDQENKQLDAYDDSLETLMSSTGNSYELVTQLIQHGRPADIVQLVTQLEEGSSGIELNVQKPPKVMMKFKPGITMTKQVKEMYGGVHAELIHDYEKIVSISSFDAKPTCSKMGVHPVAGLLLLENDDILLCTWHSKSLRRYDNKGQLKQEFYPVSGNELQNPSAITHLHDGTIAVADYDASNLKIFTQDGVFVKTMLDGKVKKPYGLAVNSKGHLIVSVGDPNKVYVFDKDETLLFTLRENFKGSCNVTVDLNDNIIVSFYGAHCVTVFDSSQNLLFTYGIEGSGDKQLQHPTGVCTDHHGNIFIADSGNDRIHLLGADGKFKHYVATKNDGLEDPTRISFNSQGDLVVGQWNGMVKIIKFEQ